MPSASHRLQKLKSPQWKYKQTNAYLLDSNNYVLGDDKTSLGIDLSGIASIAPYDIRRKHRLTKNNLKGVSRNKAHAVHLRSE